MSQQEIRREAKRAASEHQIRLRRERDQAERRYSQLGVEVAVGLGQRDEAITRFERQSAEALNQLTHNEGLNLSAACLWSGGLALTEGRRLLRTYRSDQEQGTER